MQSHLPQALPQNPTEPRSDDEVVILARFRQRRWRQGREENTALHTDLYTTPKPPSRPVALGDKVKILALSPLIYHKPVHPIPYPLTYEIYDPLVRGTVVNMGRAAPRIVEIVVKNENTESTTEYAILTMDYILGITIKRDVMTEAPWTRKEGPFPLESAKHLNIQWTAEVLGGEVTQTGVGEGCGLRRRSDASPSGSLHQGLDSMSRTLSRLPSHQSSATQ